MKLALVGCGAVAEFFHLPAIARTLRPDQVVLVDPDRSRAAALARSLGRRARVAADHRELLGAVDAAIVGVPNDLHEPVARDLLEHGVHVLCEKPLASSAAAARRLAEAAAGGPVLAVGNFRRFFGSTRQVERLLAGAAYGRPLRFAGEEGFVHTWDSVSGYWLDPVRSGGGVLIDLGSHVLDQLLLWFGGGLEVTRYEDNAYGGVECDCRVELGGEGVPAGTVELSRTRELGSRIQIECELGTIEAPLARDAESPEADGGYGDAFAAQLQNFLAAIEGKHPPAATAEDGVRVLELIETCYVHRRPLPEPWVFDTISLL